MWCHMLLNVTHEARILCFEMTCLRMDPQEDVQALFLSHLQLESFNMTFLDNINVNTTMISHTVIPVIIKPPHRQRRPAALVFVCLSFLLLKKRALIKTSP